MEIHSLATDYFSQLSIVQDWEEMLTGFNNMAAKKPAGWKLPLLGCQAVGGDQEDCVSVVAAVGCMQISITKLDPLPLQT